MNLFNELLNKFFTGGESARQFPSESLKERKALSQARRELTEQELRTPAGTKFMLDNVDRLESEVAELSRFREQYYDERQKAAVLKTEKSAGTAFGRLGPVSFTAGGVVLGMTPYLHQQNLSEGVVVAGVIGGILLIAPVVARVRAT